MCKIAVFRGLRRVPALVTALLLLGTAAYAQGRPSIQTMTCSAAAAFVASGGAVVLGTGPYTYDRFVRDGSYCERRGLTQPAWERTIDQPQCFIGYRCVGRQSGGR